MYLYVCMYEYILRARKTILIFSLETLPFQVYTTTTTTTTTTTY